ncbi:MAG: hypothetical protein LBB94_03615, partial [Clostridiales bacterium]|nr:hypothetical protein [Clostridiales bacterium]
MDPTAQYLFEYLRNVLYHPSKAELVLSNLPESFRELGEGLLFFTKCVNEIRMFSKALAAGDLNA